MQSPSLRQLEYLVAVADLGHFGQAARRCAVSQPALSKQIREAEALLEVVLFERARPRALVTSQGAPIIAQARRVLAEARLLMQVASAAQGEMQGRLHLGVIPTIGPYLVPGWLNALRRQYPDLRPILHELQTDTLITALKAGEVELALLALPFDEEGLDGVHLVDEPFVLVAPHGHPLARSAPARIAELEGASLLLMEEGHCLRDQILDVCGLSGTAPRTELRVASMSTLVRLVESGLGATLVPLSALTRECQGGAELVMRAFEDRPPSRRLVLRWRATSPRAATYRQLAAAFGEQLESLNRAVPELVHGPRPSLRE